MQTLEFELAGTRWRVDLTQPHDLSIALEFDGPQPHCFGAAAAHAEALRAGPFEGDVRRGGSCNCATHVLTPHCNGTHTECVGHLTEERISVRDVAPESLLAAQLITVEPVPLPQGSGDRIITAEILQARGAAIGHCDALVVRTLPNGADKRHRNYDDGMPPYFDPAAVTWLVERGIGHLVIDLPSLDRMADEGRLAAHRVFWGIPPMATHAAQATRPHATITELAYIDGSIADGPYVLNLQVAPFQSDAAPSRPILYPRVAL